ncbi:MAG TPA: OmpH family outer membrane protein [Bacteroidia bacterium]|nr:OmpH family outer membrane protein [Bacteroidia bacterium]
MKKTFFKSLLFGAISVLAVACNSSTKNNSNTQNDGVSSSSKSLKIMYINADTLLANYQYVLDVKKDAETQHNQIQTVYEAKAQKLQSDYQAYQEKVSKGLISQNDAKKTEADLMSRKQELDNLQAKMNDIMDSAQKKNVDIQKKVDDFLTRLQKEKHYDYVLTYTASGGSVLYANDSLDITKVVLDGLNAEYNKSNPKK